MSKMLEIIQMDLKGNEIARYGSIQRAAEIFQRNGSLDTTNCFIHRAISGIRPTAYGYKWKYAKQPNLTNEIWQKDVGGLRLNISTKGRFQEIRNGISAKKYGSVHKNRHPEYCVDGKRGFVHSLVARNFIGPCPNGQTVDHIVNGLPLQEANCVENLRYADAHMQSLNRRSWKQKSHKLLTNSDNISGKKRSYCTEEDEFLEINWKYFYLPPFFGGIRGVIFTALFACDGKE